MGSDLIMCVFVLAMGFLCGCLHASQAPKDFISIDCGALDDSEDKDYGFPYKSDKNMINSGAIGRISLENATNYRLQFRALRNFPEGGKNCYTLRPESGRNNNYLIRAGFLYGNYDAKHTTPVFNIYLGVNFWATIDEDDCTAEAIYMAPTDSIDVCLLNIGNGVPYISTLELRRYDNSIYTTNPHQLVVRANRRDVGGKYNRLRYPQDVYDRIWSSDNDGLESTSWEKIQTDERITQSPDDPYKLPELMLKTAHRTLNSNIPFVYSFTPFYATSTFYFCFHFVEIEKLNSVREMSIVLNGIHTIASSVKLQYLKPQTICSTSVGLPVNLNEGNKLQISAASGSNLPPILNGFEAFYFRNLSHSPTLLQDVNALMDIKKMSNILNSEWQGDPCLPQFSVWSGLNCSRSTPPRIISLNLSRSKLTGEIPFSISNLTQLETLDLSYNDLSGSLPEFLAELPRLKILNLTGNNLGGTVPEALVEKSRNGTLDLRVADNPQLCLSPHCKEKKNKVPVLPVIIGVVGVLILVVIFIVLFLVYKRNKKKNSIKSKEKTSLMQKQRVYSYSEVMSITNNFRDVIGEGGFGKVYKGALKDKTVVAVKLLSSTSKQGYKEFQSEAQLLMIVHHRNLVSLVGYCDDGDTKALIYEYMHNGNLRQYLYGLEYLHNGCKPPIIHRDLKPANILLDKAMQAKIADFGLSRTLAIESQSQCLTHLAGTPGYLDPGAPRYGNVNKHNDVYSLGIILLELVTGQPPLVRSSQGDFHILKWVETMMKTGDIQNIVDVKLGGQLNQNSAWKIIELAMSCTQPSAVQRPDMSHVLAELKQCLEVHQNSSIQTPIMPTINLSDSEMCPSPR